MPHVNAVMVQGAPGSLGELNWFQKTVGFLVPPLGAYWLGQEGGEQIQGALSPAQIKELPKVAYPAAPQTYGPLTIPGAWTPDEMIAQTQLQQRLSNASYGAGSRTGLEAGSKDPGKQQDDLALILVLGGMAVLGVIMVLKTGK